MYANRLKRDILHLSLLQHGFIVDLNDDEFKDKHVANPTSVNVSNNSNSNSNASGYVDGIRGMVESHITADDELEGEGDYMAEDGEDVVPVDLSFFWC